MVLRGWRKRSSTHPRRPPTPADPGHLHRSLTEERRRRLLESETFRFTARPRLQRQRRGPEHKTVLVASRGGRHPPGWFANPRVRVKCRRATGPKLRFELQAMRRSRRRERRPTFERAVAKAKAKAGSSAIVSSSQAGLRISARPRPERPLVREDPPHQGKRKTSTVKLGSCGSRGSPSTQDWLTSGRLSTRCRLHE